MKVDAAAARGALSEDVAFEIHRAAVAQATARSWWKDVAVMVRRLEERPGGELGARLVAAW